MNLQKIMQFGRYYVIFARGRQFRGRAIRVTQNFVDIACASRVVRLGAREVKAVLEPPVSDAAQFHA